MRETQKKKEKDKEEEENKTVKQFQPNDIFLNLKRLGNSLYYRKKVLLDLGDLFAS